MREPCVGPRHCPTLRRQECRSPASASARLPQSATRPWSLPALRTRAASCVPPPLLGGKYDLTGWIELCRPHLLPRRVLGRAASRCRRDDGITAAIAANEASGSAGQWSVPFQVLPLRVTSISPVRHCLRQAFRSAVEAH